MNQLVNQLRQSLNQRTIYALIALGCLLGFALIARIGDAAAGAEEMRLQADARLARHGGELDEAEWRSRAEEAELALANWSAAHWTGPTAGFIAAELQSAISVVAGTTDVTVIAVNVEPAPVETPQGMVLAYRVATDSRNGESVAKILAAFAAHEPMLFIDGMNAVFDSETRGRFSFSGYAPIVITEPQGESG